MTLVKNLRATNAFLEMPLAQRNCEVELYEDCRTRKLLEECNCVPWEMPGFQVKSLNEQDFFLFCHVNHTFMSSCLFSTTMKIGPFKYHQRKKPGLLICTSHKEQWTLVLKFKASNVYQQKSILGPCLLSPIMEEGSTQ